MPRAPCVITSFRFAYAGLLHHEGCGSRTPTYVITSFRFACTLIRMPRPMNSEINAVPP